MKIIYLILKNLRIQTKNKHKIICILFLVCFIFAQNYYTMSQTSKDQLHRQADEVIASVKEKISTAKHVGVLDLDIFRNKKDEWSNIMKDAHHKGNTLVVISVPKNNDCDIISHNGDIIMSGSCGTCGSNIENY